MPGIQIPSVPTLPSLSLSAGGGTSGSSSNAGVSVPVSNPFNFDGSGWVINLGDGNTTRAGGNSDANATSQTPSAGGGGLLGMGGMSTSTLLLLAAAYFLLAK